jgi:hypothetical protein
MIDAWYDRIEVPINDEDAITLYYVYYEVEKGDGRTCGSVYKPFGVYKEESTAKAVVEALKRHLI